MIILIHSSKTMRPEPESLVTMTEPVLVEQAKELNKYLQTLPVSEIAKCMNVSKPLAEKTKMTIQAWNTDPQLQRPAIDCFAGDIYSGLQSGKWTDKDRHYSQSSLRILSGLYGILRPLDGIRPYRLEMGYKLPKAPYNNLYTFWDKAVANTIPEDETIINLAAVEYSKVITKYIDASRFITPQFFTISPKTGEPTFVTVHSKIARGAFANWLIKNRVGNPERLGQFKDLGYTYDKRLSTPERPVYVCQNFGGIGLSMRPKKGDYAS